MTKTHRFRPRYRGIAWTSIGVGGSLAAVAAGIGFLMLPLTTGVLGLLFGAAYLASPTWRLSVVTDDDGLEVRSAKAVRFRLRWSEIVRVVAAPATHTCFVDGGTPDRSLLVPGDGAPAPYDLEDREALVATILAHVAADRVERVDSLEQRSNPAPPA